MQKIRADDRDFAAVGLELVRTEDVDLEPSPFGVQPTTKKNPDDGEQLW